MTHEALLRHTTTCFAALALVSIAGPAFAQEASLPAAQQSEAAPGDGTVTEVEWYGPTVGLLYGIGYTATGLGYYAIRPARPDGVRLVGAIVMGSGVITTVFGPMLAHFDHGSFGKGMLTLGGQVAAVAVGIAAGYGVAALSDSDNSRTAMVIGGVTVHAGWAVFDTVFLAREERVIERTIPAPSYALTLDPRGVRGEVTFRF